MSTTIKVSWDCDCEPSKTTGWICGDSDTVYCGTCEGVIANTDKITIEELQAYTKRFKQDRGLL